MEGTITEDFGIAATNFRIGVTNYTEVDLILLPYGVVNTRPFDQSAAFRNSGIGGAQLRAKINLWGNDTYGEPGSTAFALLPFVSLPPIGPTASAPPMSKAGSWDFSRSSSPTFSASN